MGVGDKVNREGQNDTFYVTNIQTNGRKQTLVSIFSFVTLNNTVDYGNCFWNFRTHKKRSK